MVQKKIDEFYMTFFEDDIKKKLEAKMIIKLFELQLNKDRTRIADKYISVSEFATAIYENRNYLKVKQNNKVKNNALLESKGALVDYVIKDLFREENFDTDMLVVLPIKYRNNIELSLIGRVDAVKIYNNTAILIEIKYSSNPKSAKEKLKNGQMIKYEVQLNTYNYMIKKLFNIEKVYMYIIFTNLNEFELCRVKNIDITSYFKKYNIEVIE